MTEKKDYSPSRRLIRLRSWRNLVLLLLLVVAVIALIVVSASRIRLSNRLRAEALAAEQAAIQEQIEIQQASQEALEEQNRLPVIDLSAWNMQLVRYEFPLEASFSPTLTLVERELSFDSRAAGYLTRLIADARSAGYEVYVCSLYRSYDEQYEIYWNHVWDYEAEGMSREEAEAATRLAVNYPGASEHQLGLAADLLENENQDMEPYIGGSGLMLWLEEHCAEYGFVIRYPDGKTDITGIEYEPWHLRYVGHEAAAYMMEHQLCLEEFLALYE